LERPSRTFTFRIGFPKCLICNSHILALHFTDVLFFF